MFLSFLFWGALSARSALAFSGECVKIVEPAFSHGYNYPEGRTRAIQAFCSDIPTENLDVEATQYAQFARSAVEQWPSVLETDRRLAQIATDTVTAIKAHRALKLRCYKLVDRDERCSKFISELERTLSSLDPLIQNAFVYTFTLFQPLRISYAGETPPPLPAKPPSFPGERTFQALIKFRQKLVSFIEAEKKAVP